MALPHAAGGRLAARPVAAPAAVPYPPGVRTLELGPHAQAQLVVPDGPPRPRPLLVFFHGAAGGPLQSEDPVLLTPRTPGVSLGTRPRRPPT